MQFFDELSIFARSVSSSISELQSMSRESPSCPLRVSGTAVCKRIQQLNHKLEAIRLSQTERLGHTSERLLVVEAAKESLQRRLEALAPHLARPRGPSSTATAAVTDTDTDTFRGQREPPPSASVLAPGAAAVDERRAPLQPLLLQAKQRQEATPPPPLLHDLAATNRAEPDLDRHEFPSCSDDGGPPDAKSAADDGVGSSMLVHTSPERTIGLSYSSSATADASDDAPPSASRLPETPTLSSDNDMPPGLLSPPTFQLSAQTRMLLNQSQPSSAPETKQESEPDVLSGLEENWSDLRSSTNVSSVQERAALPSSVLPTTPTAPVAASATMEGWLREDAGQSCPVLSLVSQQELEGLPDYLKLDHSLADINSVISRFNLALENFPFPPGSQRKSVTREFLERDVALGSDTSLFLLMLLQLKRLKTTHLDGEAKYEIV